MDSKDKEEIMCFGIAICSIIFGPLSLLLSWPDFVTVIFSSVWILNSVFYIPRHVLSHWGYERMIREEDLPLLVLMGILFPFIIPVKIYEVVVYPLVSLLFMWLKSFSSIRTIFRRLLIRSRRKKAHKDRMRVKIRCEKGLLAAMRALKGFIRQFEAESLVYEGDDLPDAAIRRDAIAKALNTARVRLESFERAYSDLIKSATMLNDNPGLQVVEQFNSFEGGLDSLLAEISEEIAANGVASDVLKSLCEEQMSRQEA